MPKKKTPERKPVAWLALEMSYPEGDAGPLPKAVRAYHERIEGICEKIAAREHVRPSISSSACTKVDGKRRSWTDIFSFQIFELACLEPTAEQLIALVRKAGLKYDHEFRLKKQIRLENDERDVYSRRLAATGNARWVLTRPQLTLKPARQAKTIFPAQLEYLATMAGRCWGLGGEDIYALFRKEADLQECLQRLQPQDRAELIAIYQTIVRKRHNQWFLEWLKENETMPAWAHELGWFLKVLDRLRQGGLLAGTRGAARQTVLYYWDDDLSGQPYRDGEHEESASR